MAFYPILKAQRFKEGTERKVLTSQYRGGYRQQRPQFTRKIKTFTLEYNALTKTQRDTLEDFIMDNQGLNFTFTHPITATTYEVTYDGDMIEFDFINPEYYKTSVILKEI